MNQHLSWLIDAKLRPNIAPDRLISRTRIRRIINQDAAKRIVFYAPPGYGKTSGMAQTFHDAKRQGLKVAWLSLEEEDGDPYQFLCYVVAACANAGCSVDYELPPHPKALSGGALNELTSVIVNAISRDAAPDLLFFDDFHRAENNETSTILRRLFLGLDQTKIFIASRAFPKDVSLAELRARGELLEVSKADLQFSVKEVYSFLGPLSAVPDRRSYSAALTEQTEGWAIALQAIRRLIGTGLSPDDALAQASGRSKVLSDYFLEQVFQSLSPGQRNLLLNTVFFERVNGDLADAICETTNSWSLLDQLDRNDIFIQSVDVERQWYRYHRLFTEFITERARRTSAINQKEIYSRAAKWYRANGYPTEALQYAIQSCDPQLIAETLDGLGGWRHTMMGNVPGVQRAVREIPRDVLCLYPTVWMADIYTKLKVGDYETAAREFYSLSTTYQFRIEADTQLRNELGIIETLLIGYRDEPERMEEMLKFLESLETSAPREDHYVHAFRFNSLCFFKFRRGDFAAALSAGEASIYHYRKVGSLYGETFIYFHQCFILYLQGRLRDAIATLDQGLTLSASHFGTESDLYAIGAAFAALFAFEQNDIVKAESYLSIALPLIEQSDAWTEVYIAAYAAGLSIAAAKRDWSSFSDYHRRAHVTAEHRSLSRVAKFADACHDGLLMRSEPLPGTVKLLRSTEEISPLNMFAFDGFFLASAYGRKLIHEGEYKEALEFLYPHVDFARQNQLNRACIALLLLCAIAHRGDGNIDAASVCFNDVLSFALYEDYRRPLIDEGRAVAALVHDVENLAPQRRHNRLRDKFLAAVLAEINAENKNENDDHILSARELDVLRNLISGRTNREISERMKVSQNTVKFHLKNLFQKLGVSSREDAVRISLRDRLL